MRFLRRSYGRTIACTVGVAIACAVAMASASPALAATRPATPASSQGQGAMRAAVHMSASQREAWQREVATTAGREKILQAFQAAFGDAASVGTGRLAHPVGNANGAGHTNQINRLSWGVTGSHFWIIASYRDVADGAVWAGVHACDAYFPEFSDLCSAAGDLLDYWASGWGSAGNHGVWAAIYWWPPHITGGRW